MAQAILFQCPVRRHPVIVAPRKVANFRVERAAHRDINLLKSPANPKERLPPLNTFSHQWQHNRIPRPVKIAMRRRGLFSVVFRMHIGPPAGEQNPSQRAINSSTETNLGSAGTRSGIQFATDATASEFIAPPACAGY